MNWHQFRTILWLRWRLSRNQLGRAGFWNAVLMTVAGILGITFAIGGCVGGFFGGYSGLEGASPQRVLIIWDIGVGTFLFFWTIGVVAEIQRSESIDLTRLLHLPVSLRDVFLVNYVACHLTLSVVLVVPAMIGLAAGLSAGRGPLMLLLFPLLFSFIFMVTAWTYCLRGWLAALMINPRRRRAIVIGVTTAFILLGQLPNLYFNLVRRGSGDRAKLSHAGDSEGQSAATGSAVSQGGLPAGFLAAHSYVPLLWVSKGAFDLARHNAWPAILCSAGALGIGFLGLRRAYLGTLRFYLGKTGDKPTRPRPRPERSNTPGSTKTLIETELPWIPEEATAMALTAFRSTMRAPEVRMTLASSFVMLAVLATMLLSRASNAPPQSGRPFVVTGAMFFVLLGTVQLMFNQFGVDRDGFRGIILLPAHRRHILLGKNLALLPVVMGAGMVMLAVLKIVIGASLVTIGAGFLQLVAGYFLMSIAGNLISILAPYRIAPGSLRSTKTPIKTTLVILVSHLLFPVAMIPTFIPAAAEAFAGFFELLPSVPINLLLSLVLAAAVAVAYRLSLVGLGELFERREIKMLRTLTHEVE